MEVSRTSGHALLTSLLCLVIFVTSSTAVFNCSGLASSAVDVCTCNVEKMSIECKNSNFTSLPSGLSSELQRLSVVESLQMIEVLDEVPYTDLIQLHLNDIGLRYIRLHAFARLGKLQTLTLTHNHLTMISNETFAGLESLQMLYLEGNSLYEITEYTFTGASMPSLSVINLAYCHIYRFASGAFYGLPNLVVINISNNHLSEFPDLDDVTSALMNLTKLDLTGNLLTSLNMASLCIPSSLQDLVLNDNALEAVTYSEPVNVTTSKALSLVTLHLRGNKLSRLDGKALSKFANLELVDLVSNQLTSVDITDWPWTTLNKVLIYDNPWDCSGCSNVWISIHGVMKDWNNETGKRPQCSTPSRYKDQFVYDVIDPSTCGVKSNAELVIVVLLFILFLTLAVVLLLVVVRRRRMKRKMASIKSTSNGGNAPTSMAYRQMRDMSPFSINDEDEEKS